MALQFEECEKVNMDYESDMTIEIASIKGKVYETHYADDDPMSLFSMVPLLPKRLLAITDTQVVDMVSLIWRSGYATVGEVHSLGSLEKLNFRRNEYITLHFRGMNKVNKYSMIAAQECSKDLQQRMVAIGKVGKTSLTPRKASIKAAAESLFAKAKVLDQEFSARPSHSTVLKIVAILREATELVGEISSDIDPSGQGGYKDIIKYFHNFLKRGDVQTYLAAPPSSSSSFSSSSSSAEPLSDPLALSDPLSLSSNDPDLIIPSDSLSVPDNGEDSHAKKPSPEVKRNNLTQDLHEECDEKIEEKEVEVKIEKEEEKVVGVEVENRQSSMDDAREQAVLFDREMEGVMQANRHRLDSGSTDTPFSPDHHRGSSSRLAEVSSPSELELGSDGGDNSEGSEDDDDDDFELTAMLGSLQDELASITGSKPLKSEAGDGESDVALEESQRTTSTDGEEGTAAWTHI